MSEQISQELGFSAEKALSELSRLDKMLGNFEKQVGSSAKVLDLFNKKGGSTVAMLKKIASEGDRASKSLAKVAALSGQVSATPGVGGIGGPAVKPLPSVDAYIKQLETMYKVSDKASTSQKRAFQSAITSGAEFAAKNKVSIGQVITQSKSLDKNFTGTANTMANKLAQISQASKRHLNAAGQSARKLSIDLATMVRIITTQAIVRALSQLRNLIRGAVTDAVEFQTRVAEIGTIAPINDLAELADHVRRISDEFNAPLDTTAKGYYQTISNQIGQATGDFNEFMEAAARFSKTSVTDLASAVNLGSGALNAYGKSASDAEDTFAKFFMTIKKGRIVGQELAQGMGSVMPLAAKLNIEMEELNAAMATITIQGISADKAFTQLRGVFNSFMKPTKEMSAALKELGFATGEDILVAHDLQTALRLVASTTDGTAEGLAKLIPRIRGMTGGLSLVNDEAEHFTATMKAQEEQLEKMYAEAYKLVIETDAFKVTKELNQLSNYMTTQFGESILQAAGRMLQFVGGAEQMQRVFSVIGPQLPNIALGIGAIGIALAALAIKAKLATAGLASTVGMVGVLAAIPVAMALGDYIAKDIMGSWDAEYRAFKELMDLELEARKRKNAAEIASEKGKVKELESLMAVALAGARRQYYQIADQAAKHNDVVLGGMKYFSDSIIREAQRTAQAAVSASEGLGKSVLASEQKVGKMRTQLDDRIFSERIKNQSAMHKVFALTERSVDLASTAARKLKDAVSDDQRDSANEEFRRAKAFAEQAFSIAEGTDNRTLERKALEGLEALTKNNIRAEEQYQQTLAAGQEVLARRAQREENRVAALKKKQEELLDAYTLYDKETGELLSSAERGAKLKDAGQKLREFIQLATKGKPLDVSQMLNYANLSTQMSREMEAFRIHELRASDAALQGLHQQIQNSFKQFQVETPAAGALWSLTGMELTGERSERAALQQLSEEYGNLLTVKGQYKNSTDAVANATTVLKGALEEVQVTSKSTSVFLGALGAKVGEGLGLTDGVNLVNSMTTTMELMNRAASGGTVTLEELQTAVDDLAKTEQDQTWLGDWFSGNVKGDVANALAALSELLTARKELAEVQEIAPEQASYEAVLQRLKQIDAVRQSLKDSFEQPKLDAQSMNTAIGSAAIATSNAATSAAQMSSHWSSIAMSAQMAAMASQQIRTPAMVAQGGPIRHLASGGSARGTDQVPAMLSRGEFVVNAASTRKFYSQLSAMNAGVQPIHREAGGTVTNIGDVAINVTGSQSPQQTAREVMKAFRREERRGSGRL